MKNELKMIEALQDVAKTYGYNLTHFSADKHDGVTMHFDEPDYIELHANGEIVSKIAKET